MSVIAWPRRDRRSSPCTVCRASRCPPPRIWLPGVPIVTRLRLAIPRPILVVTRISPSTRPSSPWTLSPRPIAIARVLSRPTIPLSPAIWVPSSLRAARSVLLDAIVDGVVLHATTPHARLVHIVLAVGRPISQLHLLGLLVAASLIRRHSVHLHSPVVGGHRVTPQGQAAPISNQGSSATRRGHLST